VTAYDEMRERAARLRQQVRDKELTLDEATDELFSFITNNQIEITRYGAEKMVDPRPQPSGLHENPVIDRDMRDSL
jgi:hypothetical protein